MRTVIPAAVAVRRRGRPDRQNLPVRARVHHVHRVRQPHHQGRRVVRGHRPPLEDRRARRASAESPQRIWSVRRGRVCHRRRRRTSWRARRTAPATVARPVRHLQAPCGPHGGQDRRVPRGGRPAPDLHGSHLGPQPCRRDREFLPAARAAERQRPSPARRRSPPWLPHGRFPAYVSSQAPWKKGGAEQGTTVCHIISRRCVSSPSTAATAIGCGRLVDRCHSLGLGRPPAPTQ